MLTENIRRFLAGEQLDATYDGHANCFIETGFGKAVLIDFNYDTEPLPGHYPGPVGLPLLKESHLNHLGKLMFEWFYWHACSLGTPFRGFRQRCPPRASITQPRCRVRGGTTCQSRHSNSPISTSTRRVSSCIPRTGRRRWSLRWLRGKGSVELTDRHWQVIRFMRSEYFEKGTGPTVRVLGKTSGVCIKELYQLFPKGPAKVAARIAGIPKPRGCI